MVDDRLDPLTSPLVARVAHKLPPMPAVISIRDGSIRPLTLPDIPPVADLYNRVFLNPKKPVPRALGHHLEQQFLSNQTGDAASLVYVRDGVVSGFVGAMPLSMVVDDRSIRAVTIGSFMVDRRVNDPLGGARLLRAMAAGPQDLTISETANSTSLMMWRSLRGTVLPGYSLDWLKVLSPARYLAARLARRFAPAHLSQPIAGAVDRLFARRANRNFNLRPRQAAMSAASHEISIDEATAIIRNLSLVYRVRPDWAGDTLEQRVDAALRKTKYGSLTCRSVTGAGGGPIGLFLYHAKRSNLGHVLQILAKPGMEDLVVDQLFRHAAANGVAALSGRTDPTLLDALLGRNCTFANFSSTVVSARDKSLIAAIREGRALITGLAGETWAPFAGHDLDAL